MALEHLFDAELQYQPGMAPLAAEGEGLLVGSGDGTVAGPLLRGALRWTLFRAAGRARLCHEPDAPDRNERRDGDPRRRSWLRNAGAARAREWRVAATPRFRTDDARNAWLDGALELWEGDCGIAPATARSCSASDHRKEHE